MWSSLPICRDIHFATLENSSCPQLASRVYCTIKHTYPCTRSIAFARPKCSVMCNLVWYLWIWVPTPDRWLIPFYSCCSLSACPLVLERSCCVAGAAAASSHGTIWDKLLIFARHTLSICHWAPRSALVAFSLHSAYGNGLARCNGVPKTRLLAGTID